MREARMRTVEVVYLDNFKKPKPQPKRRKERRRGKSNLKAIEWVRWALEETGGVSSLDLSIHVGGEQALRRASQDHQDWLDVRMGKRDLQLDQYGVEEEIDMLEGFKEFVDPTSVEKREQQEKWQDDLADWEIDVMEQYIWWAEQEDESAAQARFLELREAKNTAWTRYHEEMDWNWLAYDVYEAKLNTMLKVLEAKGEEPTEKSWNAAMAYLSKLQRSIVRWYTDKRTGEARADFQGYQGQTVYTRRNRITYPLLQEALRLTAEYKAFWESEEGKELSELKAEKKAAWKDVLANDLDFWRLRALEDHIHTPWWINREPDEEIDDPGVRDDVRANEWADYAITGPLALALEGVNSDSDYDVMEMGIDKHEPIDYTGIRIKRIPMWVSGKRDTERQDMLSDEDDSFWASLEATEVRGRPDDEEVPMMIDEPELIGLSMED